MEIGRPLEIFEVELTPEETLVPEPIPSRDDPEEVPTRESTERDEGTP